MISAPAVLPYLSAARKPLISAAPPSPATSFGEVVKDTRQQWAHQGKKLGKLAAVSAGQLALPLAIGLHYTTLAPIVLSPVGVIASLVLMSLEEKHIGIGKHVGALAGHAAGAVAGAVTASYRQLHPAAPRPQKIQLQQRAPRGAGPREAVLPRLLHAAEKKLLGNVPQRTRPVEVCENVGATLTTLAGAYLVPTVVAASTNGPLSLAAGSLVGLLAGLLVGGIAENTLGVGRGVGELVGQVISKVSGADPAAAQQPAPPPPAKKSAGGMVGKAFLELNHAIADSIIPALVDGSALTNRLFSETPVQSMAFADRPAPQVDRERVVNNFIKLAGINGPTDREQEIAAEVSRQLKDMGIPHTQKPDGTIIGTVAGTVADAPTVLLSAHMDTVTATSPAAIRRDSKRIFTDESHILGGDDRAGVAEILEGVRSILEQGLDHPEIKLVFTVGEEGGLKGAARLSPDEVSTRPTLGYIMDSTDIRDINLTNDAVIVAKKSIKYQFSQEDPVVQVAFRSMAEAGCKPRPLHCPIMTGAGTDANTVGFNSKHIRSIALGAGENDIHTVLENIKIDDLEQASRHVAGVIVNSCDLKVQGNDIVPRYPLQ